MAKVVLFLMFASNIVISYIQSAHIDNGPIFYINGKQVIGNPLVLNDFPELSNETLSEDTEYPSKIIVSKNGETYMMLCQYEGNAQNVYSLIMIGYVSNLKTQGYDYPKTTIEHFDLENGIKLGDNYKHIIDIQGHPHELYKNADTTITKYVYTEDKYQILKGYNMPPYFMRFRFISDVLDEITFGFEYP